MANTVKIVFAGLDDGGKTSILNILNQKKYILEGLKPTLGIERVSIDILDCCFNEWDLGGQEKYRRQYLENEKTFYDTDLLFFVIDIADTDRYTDAFDYYKSIIKILTEQDPKPTIIILLNKNDKFQEIYAEKLQNLQNSILDISRNFKLEFFRTSIFEPQTLMNAFSHGVTRLSKKSNELNNQLKHMAEETFADAILLMEKNGFILGEYAKDADSHNMCMIVYNNLIGAFTYMYKTLTDVEKPERILIDWEDKGHAFLGSSIIDGLELFYVKYTNNPRQVVQKFVLRSLINSSKQIKGIVKSYFE
ncbi:MAG: ADP-ribosylation factor-like protein [Candidatus Helarchaeota archaeon]